MVDGVRLAQGDFGILVETVEAPENDACTDAIEIEPSDDDVIEILRVSSECLQKVVEFLKHYHEEKMKEIPTPLGGSSFNEVCFQLFNYYFLDIEKFWSELE